MRRFAPLILVLLAFVTVLLTVIGDNSYGKLVSFRRSLQLQRAKNAELEAGVGNLKREVYGLQHDSREIEKAARNELGMARPNEFIFFFDNPGGSKEDEASKSPQE